ncbi:hypothetical protein ASE95_08770 [Sphingomonas sp. Leaf231]|uniref:DUF1190 domain-containing protein n=1 Tax=Sphingomonas sp. Leaf231 TaxID=1736301 RepID=UPI0006F237E7|nr:DUF1190 domain-containing protein [Sphingomonas sp. Leaf231]KQN92745.1 hypothetical protein ASE95_08770 [Sphingomonas sp. Leaf231]
MIDRPFPPRKRSAAAGLTAAGALAMLSGCDGAPDDQARFGPPTEVSAFSTVEECVASGAFAKVTCENAAKEARKTDEKAAPRFDSKGLCEDQFGGGQCLARNEGGQSFFVPLLTGFMIGQMLNGSGGYRYNGLYRNGRNNSWYTPGGAWLTNGGYGGRGYNYQVGSRAVTAPVTTQRIQTRSSVVSRGGFGGRVSARSSGGWGGGRSFGG